MSVFRVGLSQTLSRSPELLPSEYYLMVQPPTKINWPIWNWPTSGWAFTVLGSLLGGLLLAFPTVTTLEVRYRIVLLIILAILPVVVLACVHALNICSTFFRRGTEYITLLGLIDEYSTELNNSNQIVSGFLAERQEKRSLTIDYCYFYEPNAIVVLHKKRGFSVDVGDILTVVDTDEGRLLGTIEITVVNSNGYTAKIIGDVDALWMGHIRNTGAGHSYPPPTALAFLLNTNEVQNDK